MNSPERVSPEARKPVAGYLWGLLAALTCPCHLPVLAIVLAGTTAGAFLGEHWIIAALGGHSGEIMTASQQTDCMAAQVAVAVERGQFELHYQPIVNLRSDAIAGAEALLRWRHPTLGLLPPGRIVRADA